MTVMLFPDLIQQKNISMSSYKKYFNKVGDVFYRNIICSIDIHRNGRIKLIEFYYSTIFYYNFNKNGNLVNVLDLHGKDVMSCDGIQLASEYDFKQTMRNHGIKTVDDMINTGNREIINFYIHMFFSNDIPPFKISDKTFVEFLDETKQKNELY